VIVSSTQEIQTPSNVVRSVSEIAHAIPNIVDRGLYSDAAIIILEPANTDPAVASATPTGARLEELSKMGAELVFISAPGQFVHLFSRVVAIFDVGLRCV